jgi:sulfate transport system substrate-binding protein
MMKKRMIFLTAAVFFLCGCSIGGSAQKENDQQKAVTLVNASYDSSREFFSSYNEIFQNYWQEETGGSVNISMSYDGSVNQAKSQIEKKEADVVTLSTEQDVTTLQNAGLIAEGWEKEFDQQSVPFTSMIVFLVRKGNPKEIYDWGDLVQNKADIITSDPETSGGGRWNFLGAAAYAKELQYSSPKSIRSFLKDLYSQVLVLDSSARNSVNTFVERGQGDVLITWENEAYLTMEEYPQDYEVVMPKITIQASPVAAVVDSVTEERDTGQVAEGYIQYLYSDDAQRLAGEYYLRPSDQSIFEEFQDQFKDPVSVVTIEDFGGWSQAYTDYFSESSLFRKVYKE